LIGVYENSILIEKFQSQEKTSDILPKLFDTILNKYNITDLYFAKGPGSFMAIKITYLFLKTVSITKNLPLFATDGFAFNQNSPIKAVGTLYFIKKNGKISTQKIDEIKEKIKPFDLPKILDKKIFTTESEPLYILPAL
jgi:tRNA A37 threonylcarbamoyladenosine modification protein TsaB